MKYFCLISFTFLIQFNLLSQQNYYPVSVGNGYGIRFWNSDTYKISMGNTTEYKYGPVTDYSIKTQMSNNVGRGFTWGIGGQPPVAAMDIAGNFQIKGNFNTQGEISTITTSHTKLQMAVDDWGGSHGMIFNAYKVHADGDLTATGNIKHANHAVAYSGGAGMIHFLGNGGVMDFYISPLSAGANTDVFWGVPKMRILRNGNVGIGTANPDQRLTVKGKIKAEEVQVVVAVPADYVFEADYTLMPLEELSFFVKTHKHLPGVPSAAELIANGWEAGAMGNKLLEKIEEFTLYVIELQKQQILLEQQLNALKAHDGHE